VSANRTPAIRATLNSVTKSKTLTVVPPTVRTVVVMPVNFVGGSSTTVTGTVNLNAPAPTGGIVVSLSDDSAVTGVPASVTVLAGSSSQTFNVTHSSVATDTVVTITGTTGAVTASDTVNVKPPAVSTFTFSPTTVVGGSSTVVSGTVTINAPAPAGGYIVNLSSNDTAAAEVPATVTIAAGATSAPFTVTHKDVATQHIVTLSAVAGGVTKTKNLTVNP
jgi:trimeric autotransporter adhesin